METCLLIPEKLTIAVTRHLDPHSMVKVASIWSKTAIPVGHTFYSDEGQINHGDIDIYSVMEETDTRQIYGGYDLVLNVQGHKMRHCNWIRFIQSSNDLQLINLVATKEGSRTAYRTVKEVAMGEEMIVYFKSTRSINKTVESENVCTNGQPDNDEESEIDVCGISEDEEDITEESKESKQSLITSPHTTFDTSSRCLRKTPASAQPRKRMRLNQEEKEFDSGFGETLYTPEVVSVILSPEKYEVSLKFRIYNSASPHTTFDTSSRCLRKTPANAQPRKRMRLNQEEKEFDSGFGETLYTPEVVSVILSPEKYETFKREHSTNNDDKRHSTPIHSNTNPLKRKRGKTYLKCEFCDKEFDRPSLLKRHERTHTGEKPHVCDVCGKAFSTTSSLNTHRRIHFGEKPHECDVCGKKFTANSNLYYHKMTHTKDKPHKCTLCTKSFPTPGDLRSHLHIHNGTYPFTCSMCHKGFSKQASLKHHMISHTDNQTQDRGDVSQQPAATLTYASHPDWAFNNVAWLNTASSIPVSYMDPQF